MIMSVTKHLLSAFISITIFVFSAAILLKVACEAPEITDYFIFQKNYASECEKLLIHHTQANKPLPYNCAITRDAIISYLEKQKNSPPSPPQPICY